MNVHGQPVIIAEQRWALSDWLAGGMQARLVDPHQPAINEGKMSDAEFEAAHPRAQMKPAIAKSAAYADFRTSPEYRSWASLEKSVAQ